MIWKSALLTNWYQIKVIDHTNVKIGILMGRVFFTNQLVIQMSFTFHAVQLQLLLFIFKKQLFLFWGLFAPLRWRHHERDGVSNHQRPKVCTTVCTGSDQSKHQSSASLAFVRGIHRWLVNSPHKGPVTRKMFPFDDVIMPALVVGNSV